MILRKLLTSQPQSAPKRTGTCGSLRAAIAAVGLAVLLGPALSAAAVAREKHAPSAAQKPAAEAPTGQPAQAGTKPAAAPAATAPGAAPPPAAAAPAEPLKSEATAKSEPVPGAAKPVAPSANGESVEADVSTRSVAVTSGFRGGEVVVFGAVVNSQQESAESGLYDVVLVVEGSPTPAVVRRKTNVGGIWLNTSSLRYDRVPSYFAIVSTRPLEEVADEKVLAENLIGFKHIRFEAALGAAAGLSEPQRNDFRSAIVRLKEKDGLYFTEDYGVVFIGKSLFRSTVTLPANVKVGPVAVHVLLFRDGVLLSRMTSRVVLARQGIEHFIYASAFTHPLLYGLAAVAIAIGVGMLASLLVRRPG